MNEKGQDMCIFGNAAVRQGVNMASDANVDTTATGVSDASASAAKSAVQSTAAIYRSVYPTGTRRTLVNPSGISKSADTAPNQLTTTAIDAPRPQWAKLTTAQKQRIIASQGALAA